VRRKVMKVDAAAEKDWVNDANKLIFRIRNTFCRRISFCPRRLLSFLNKSLQNTEYQETDRIE
jgi:hypothetical protein